MLTRVFLLTIVATCTFSIAWGKSDQDSIPSCQDALEYSFTGFCTEFISEIHGTTSEPEKRILAQAYYGALFVMWSGTNNPRLQRVVEYDMTGNARSFVKYSKLLNFEHLIELDDPLKKRNIPPEVAARLADSFGGSAFYQWILRQTAEPSVYKKDVEAFREFMNKAGVTTSH